MLKEILELLPVKEILMAGVKGYVEVANKFVDNYTKRSNSGFNNLDSLKGTFKETTGYYCDSFVGKKPKEWIQAVYFLDNNGNEIK